MHLDYTLTLAQPNQDEAVWAILQQGIAKRKQEGSTQWQDGYPNLDVVRTDIAQAEGYVVTNTEGTVVAYQVLSARPEPAYEALPTGWLTQNQPYLVIHRMAVTQTPKIKGLATWMLQQAERIATEKGIKSIKVDTNFDNAPMLALFKKLGYTYVGEVYFRGSARMAFEKIL
ncbi:GNAT family N-acetyltransferase [Flavobacterium agricola]|uniref:GNAT family N-acetyltransferase n=1 Tax=Flavobacterium agricola TaxID=2870839 RepID=A0ABY6LVL5_9FLAO|nr:GNAT family N-acetyltransferase [Flavobacterium agricola]UYW00365.1 GNAT family N-acetyltransferase [Flavobacterium agricola]